LDHKLEGVVKTLEEGCLLPINPLLIDLIGPPLTELTTSIRYFDAFATCRLSPNKRPWNIDLMSIFVVAIPITSTQS
jgi:hypothetical protein